jgi:hypothetical protein
VWDFFCQIIFENEIVKAAGWEMQSVFAKFAE